MLIINNDDTIFHTEDTLKNIENTNIEYISFEDYITKNDEYKVIKDKNST